MANVFNCTDPRGFKVSCSDGCWNNHILAGHSNLAGQEHIVQQAIEQPILNLIFEDTDDANRACYYGTFGNRKAYMKVVVEFDQGKNKGEVRTAFPTANLKSGEELIWPKD